MHYTTIYPQIQRFEPTTMHFTTIDHALTTILTPKRQRFEPTAMHFTTIDPQKDKDSKTRPCTAPLTQKRQKFEPMTMHSLDFDLRKTDSLDKLRKGLKTHLFRKHLKNGVWADLDIWTSGDCAL
jgi:hypothetical protein